MPSFSSSLNSVFRLYENCLVGSELLDQCQSKVFLKTTIPFIKNAINIQYVSSIIHYVCKSSRSWVSILLVYRINRAISLEIHFKIW